MTLRRIPGSSVWVYQCKINGKTFTRSTGQSDRKKAEKEVPRLRKLVQLLRSQPHASLKLSAAIVQEVARVEADVSKIEGERVLCALRSFLEFAGDISLERIDTAFIEQYQRKRLAEISQRTVSMELSYVLRMLRLRGFDVTRPAAKRGRVTAHRAFTRDELHRFFQACPPRYKTLYALMPATGARQAELVPSTRSGHTSLLKSELDLEQKTVSIRSAKARRGTQGKVRVLPLPEELLEPLRAQMAAIEGPFVFRRYASSRRDFDAILRRAGVPKRDTLGRKITAHSFRHTYATMMAEAIGHNPFVLKEILGHQQLSTTDRYCHVTAPQIALPVEIEFDQLGVRGVSPGCKVVDVAAPKGA